MTNKYKVGDRVAIKNSATGTPDYGTIVHIEQELYSWEFWAYIVSDVAKNNVRKDPNFPEAYWKIKYLDSESMSLVE